MLARQPVARHHRARCRCSPAPTTSSGAVYPGDRGADAGAFATSSSSGVRWPIRLSGCEPRSARRSSGGAANRHAGRELREARTIAGRAIGRVPRIGSDLQRHLLPAAWGRGFDGSRRRPPTGLRWMPLRFALRSPSRDDAIHVEDGGAIRWRDGSSMIEAITAAPSQHRRFHRIASGWARGSSTGAHRAVGRK